MVTMEVGVVLVLVVVIFTDDVEDVFAIVVVDGQSLLPLYSSMSVSTGPG